MKRIFSLILFIVILLEFNATTFIVSSTGDAGAGTLRQAVLDANTQAGEDTLIFDAATNGIPLLVTAGGDLIIEESLVIIGNGITQTIIEDDLSSGGAATFLLNSGKLEIQDVQFTKFYNCIRSTVPGHQIIATRCLFNGDPTSNVGIVSFYSKIQVNECYFESVGNWGISGDLYVECKIENTTFNNCSTGAIGLNSYYNNIQLEISNSTFTENGKAISIALANDLQVGELINNTIYNNQTALNIIEDLDGTKAGFGSSLTLVNNIISSNSYSLYLYNDNFLGAFGGNPNCTNNICDGGTQLSPYGSVSWSSTNDPLLDPAGLSDNGGTTPTVAILAGSPAIDAADITYAPLLDQRQFFRSGPPDIGSFEHNGTSCNLPSNPIVTSAESTVCLSSSTTLNISGALNDAAYWSIYSGSCGGTLIGNTNGNSFVVTPTFPSTTYYVRGEGGCVTPGVCSDVTVSVANHEDPTFNFVQGMYCMSDLDPTPIISGVLGGSFSSTPVGLSIDPSSGTIDLDASIPKTYTIRYTAPGICADFHEVQVIVDPCVPDTQIKAAECGKTLSSFTELFYADPVANGEKYEFQFLDPVTLAEVSKVQSFYAKISLDLAGLNTMGTSYEVKVRARVNGYWGDFASSCIINTPVAIPTTNLSASSCGIAVSTFPELFYADPIGGADQYEYEFTDQSTSVVTTHVRFYAKESLDLAGLTTPGASYDVRVRVKVNGVWGDYGAICTIDAPAALPTTQLRPVSCGAQMNTFGELFYADIVASAERYQFEFTNTSSGVVTRNVRLFPKNSLTLAGLNEYDAEYDVRVRVKLNGVWGNYGPICSLFAPSSSALAVNDDINSFELEEEKDITSQYKTTIDIFANSVNAEENMFSETTVYPNPFRENVTIDFAGNDLEKEIKVFNSLGQVVISMNTSDTFLILDMNDLNDGVYIMQVVAGEQMKTMRLVKH